MGNRDGIDEMSATNSNVLLSILKLIDKYDLYGQVSYPKHHKQPEVADIYRLAAKTKVCFCLYVEVKNIGCITCPPKLDYKEILGIKLFIVQITFRVPSSRHYVKHGSNVIVVFL